MQNTSLAMPHSDEHYKMFYHNDRASQLYGTTSRPVMKSSTPRDSSKSSAPSLPPLPITSPSTRQERYIWIITGPAGCGKTTVGQYLADKLNMPYIEGDEYHPTSNVDKMARNIALTDSDRWDWLEHLRQAAVEKLSEDSCSGVIMTCSALKRKYRDVIRIASYNDHDVLVRFVYLRANEDVLKQRVRDRKNHYMKEDMVHSQFTSLEEPLPEKETDCLAVDVSGSPSDAMRQSYLAVVKRLASDS